MARLRDSREDLFALVGRASDGLGLPLEFVEKDFWITELLRSVTEPIDDAYVVFKGGTSLSKAFGLIERFSEDVDLLVVTRPLAKDFGKGSVDKILKALCSRVGLHLGIPESDQTLEASGKGEHRNVRYGYPASVGTTVVRRGVLLEMGVRGGPNPSSRREVRSYVSQYATESLGLSEDEYEEFGSVSVEVLGPERTLFEKLAVLHHLATNHADSADHLGQALRHLYDVYKLVTSPNVVSSLREQPNLAAEMALDIEAISLKWGWVHTPRPEKGYADSPIFDSSHPCQKIVVEAWGRLRPLIFGTVPSVDDCREAVHEVRDLL